MAKVVFILGAGASVDAGAPLMYNFLDRAEFLFATGQIDEEEKRRSFELVFKALHALRAVSAKADIDQDNLESVFAIFEMAKLVGRLGDIPLGDVDRLPDALRDVIQETLLKSIHFPFDGSGKVQHPGHYENLTQSIAQLREGKYPHSVAVITFNYDPCVDYSLAMRRTPVIYCFDGAVPESDSRVRLLKLHGSLTWGLCDECNKLCNWEFGDAIAQHAVMHASGSRNSARLRLRFEEMKKCDHAAPTRPFIVPPTWNKGEHHARISRIWRAAAVELQNAEHIFVAGYSLPDSDHFFKNLFALGADGTGRIKSFRVFDPNIESVRGRVEAFLGSNVKRRLSTHAQDFQQATYAMLQLTSDIGNGI